MAVARIVFELLGCFPEWTPLRSAYGFGAIGPLSCLSALPEAWCLFGKRARFLGRKATGKESNASVVATSVWLTRSGVVSECLLSELAYGASGLLLCSARCLLVAKICCVVLVGTSGVGQTLLD